MKRGAAVENPASSMISADIISIAQLGIACAMIGYITLDSNSGVVPLKTQKIKFTAAIRMFNQDLF